MPLSPTAFQDTPNPNAVKITLDRRVSESSRSFFNAQQAASDPIASRLFAIEGVTNVLIHGDWLTVVKRPEFKWPALRRAVERALGEVP